MMKIIAIARVACVYVKLLIKKVSGVNCSFSPYNHVGRRVAFYFDKGANITLGRHIGLRDNVCLSVRKGATLILGESVFLNNGCQVVAHCKISLGDFVRCGQNTMFFDHDYDYRNEKGIQNREYLSKEIVVGKGTWIGASCIILKGTIIGENCVIGGGSIVKGVIPDNSVVIQKRDEEIHNLHDLRK